MVKRKCKCKGSSERRASSLCEDYSEHILPTDHDEERVCYGFGFGDSITIEKLFKVRIAVFSLTEDGVANVERSSRLHQCD